MSMSTEGYSVEIEGKKSLDFFEKKIRPVLAQKCYSCHSAEAARNSKLKGNLQLDNRKGTLAGGENGTVLVPGAPEKSRLLAALRHENLEMPPKERLPDAVIADFEKWIKEGAYDPREGEPAQTTAIDYEAGRKHWAYQPLRRDAAPKVKDGDWPTGIIDRHLLARMEKENLRPTRDAEPLTTLRRMRFDLTGLPPTLEEVAKFEKLSDKEPASAYEILAKELLNSPAFGEQWARHWLDGIRFNPQLETAAYYRNWVIDAYNADMPYHEFLRRQIAGDLLPAKNESEQAANLIATQMLTHNRFEADFVEGAMEVLGQQVLGISLNCAKCHDHKYDTISQEDYYALAGIYKSCKVPKAARDGPQIPGSDEKVLTLFDEDPKRIGDTYLLLGGDPSRRGDLVRRRLPTVFFDERQPPIESKEASGRLELANWVGSPGNPLTARVMVNRIWLRLMGRGITPTPNDFGANGDPPTNPLLLDHLASRLVDSKGSVKTVVREIVLSRAYRQSVTPRDASLIQDPANAFHTRALPKRLTVEQIMDQLLALADALEPGMVKPVVSISKWPTQRRRDKTYGGPRSIYARLDTHYRNTFDGPNHELLVVERSRSVTAPQALLFLNSQMLRTLSATITKRIEKLAPSENDEDQVGTAYRLLYARPPTRAEHELGADFVSKHGLLRYVHALTLSTEFIHLN